MKTFLARWWSVLRKPVALHKAPSVGWVRVEGQLIYRESIPFNAEDWLHPLNAIREELGRSGSIEHIPSIDTHENPLRSARSQVPLATSQSHQVVA